MTMTNIEVTCPKCGPVPVSASAITVESWTQRYRFHCPRCYRAVRRAASMNEFDVLVEQGAHVRQLPSRISRALPLLPLFGHSIESLFSNGWFTSTPF